MFELSTSDARPDDTDQPNHRCLADRACRGRGADGAPAFTEYQDSLCDACHRHITKAVKQLPDDWADLQRALGERGTTGGDYVRSTPTPAIPISVTRERLMAEICELADRAAAIVADELHADQPTGRRTTPEMMIDGKRTKAGEGSAAHTAAQSVKPTEWQMLTAAVKMVEPNIDLLATAPATDALIWRGPRRCTEHAEPITDAEAALAAELDMPDTDAGPKQVRAFLRRHFRARSQGLTAELNDDQRDAMDMLSRAFTSAAACDDCNGWDTRHGQAREFVEIAGIDVALAIIELHNRIRAELGKTRLRHRYSMPCPNCQASIGRDDGAAIVTCDNDDCTPRGPSSWTEREYKFLAGIVVDREKEMQLLKYLIAERDWRLDEVQAVLDKLTGDDAIDLPGAGRLIIDALTTIVGDHLGPDDRAAASDKASAEQRQDSDDTWTWKNEKPYQRPKRKTAKATAAPAAAAPRIAESSRSTLVEDPTYLPDATDRRYRRCTGCNLIHPPGDCIA